jgi:hypothetical protein
MKGHAKSSTPPSPNSHGPLSNGRQQNTKNLPPFVRQVKVTRKLASPWQEPGWTFLPLRLIVQRLFLRPQSVAKCLSILPMILVQLLPIVV